jgi:hypothetical protein
MSIISVGAEEELSWVADASDLLYKFEEESGVIY